MTFYYYFQSDLIWVTLFLHVRGTNLALSFCSTCTALFFAHYQSCEGNIFFGKLPCIYREQRNSWLISVHREDVFLLA